ncbi:hypothetical protein [Alteribacillus iranensis]|uniref:Uncharacterized protein n=1 Tax=Alteribacillus iranensis TaxID=930128 RepID=A0A1I2ECR8_9BACI|nr:hypothetical protein [Alteribacillus iranensis]SFE90050.1 hypothetical protein SAMN05192532_105242 [Alteribacillus iranensis]
MNTKGKPHSSIVETDSAISRKQIKTIVVFTFCVILAAFTLWGAMYSSEGYVVKSVFGVTSVVAFLQALIQLSNVQVKEEKE